LGGTKTEIAGGIIAEIKQKAPNDYETIEQQYAKITYDNYFKNHEIIFINNASGAKLGNIEAIKQVTLKDIIIERVTSGTIKPRIKL
jgi:hypothetical protein